MGQPFNEIEMMVLSKLSYLDMPFETRKDGTPTIENSLHTVLKDDSIYPELEKEFGKDVVDSLINRVENQDYTIVKSVADQYETGFAAIAIEGPDEGTVTVAARGTEFAKLKTDPASTIKDISTDGQLGASSETDQQKAMDDFMCELGDEYDSIYLTGHSLGGNLAVSGAVGYQYPDKIKGVYTYNAPGQNSKYIIKNATRIARVRDKIVNYQNENDVVSDINAPIGEVRYVKSNTDKLVGAHLLSGFVIKKNSDESFDLTEAEDKDDWHKAVSLLVQYITSDPLGLALLRTLIFVIEMGIDISMLIAKIEKWYNDNFGKSNQKKKTKSSNVIITGKEILVRNDISSSINAYLKETQESIETARKEVLTVFRTLNMEIASKQNIYAKLNNIDRRINNHISNTSTIRKKNNKNGRIAC